MIQIKPLGFRDYYRALALLKASTSHQPLYKTLNQWPVIFSALQWAGRILPLALKRFPAVYVAVARKEVLGLIWLKRDHGQASRWRINAVVIHPNAATYDVGTQLVNFAVNRHGAEGVQTFVANIPHNEEQSLELYKSCGFRQVTRCHVFQAQPKATDYHSGETPSSLQGLRESAYKDKHKLKMLRDEMLPIETRLSLSPSEKSLGLRPLRWISRKFSGQFFRRWVMDEPVHDSLTAAVTLVTSDYEHFELSIWLSPGWSGHYKALLEFGLARACQHHSAPKIRLSCYTFEKESLAAIEASVFERTHEIEVLVKDYWVPLKKQKPALTDPVMLFGGGRNPSTATMAN